MQNFILVYNHEQQRLQDLLRFEEDGDAAICKYEALEADYRDSPFMDILFVGADSLETIKVTHSSYFTGEAQKNIEASLRMLDMA
ncbi:MAG: hypothetical protein L0K41_08415 [Yaniella sp.]|nr:hypothetical protein [Yaniella sp.]MDN5731650.1 hypothetical protein [Yaniella sp.]MDN6456979.1 hypothetical protein [Yaniella sp.]MDN6490410.1 hypothetical protein [Yaniella sp.]MDN6638516.1 hypothetical protein [Yaniella sp.]